MEGNIDHPEEWLDAHGDVLYRYALLRLRDPHKAEEAVQDTLLAALQGRERFSGNASVRTWLVGILKHKILDQFRYEARIVSQEDPDDPLEESLEQTFTPAGHWSARLADWDDPEATLENQQFWTILQYCLDHLPTRLARLFVLREVMEEGTETICQELAITPTNLWTMLYRARMGLRQCLDRNWVGKTGG